MAILSFQGGESAAVDFSCILPDYMLSFAVAVLTHDPNYTSHLGKGLNLDNNLFCTWRTGRYFLSFSFFRYRAFETDQTGSLVRSRALDDEKRKLLFRLLPRHDPENEEPQ